MAIGIEEINAVNRVMKSKILSGYQANWSDSFYGGIEVKALEQEWAEYFGVNNAIACNSATSGLWMACNAIGLTGEIHYDNGTPVCLKAPDEIIVSPYSMTCSASIPLLFGAKPVFADIEPDYYCLDPKSVEERITERTKAIIVVDLFGHPYDVRINEIAEEYGEKYGHKIWVIEDAAQAAGAKYKDKYAGTLGDIGVYSLNVHKPIQCGEGGIVVTDDSYEITMKLRLSMNHGEAVENDVNISSYYNMYENQIKNSNIVGMNLRMTEIQAAIAREQLRKLAVIVGNNIEHAKGIDIKVREHCEHSYYRYAWKATKGEYKTLKYLSENNKIDINIKRHYITPINLMPLFKGLGYEDNCPVCKEVNENIVLAWLK